jgi:hypothetical protein
LPANATTKQKGNFGEMCSYDKKVNNPTLKKQGYDLERIGNEPPPKGLDSPIKQGIDGIYENKKPPPKYVIDEAKFGSSQLGHTKDGRQMSDKWVRNRIDKQFSNDPKKAKEIKDGLKNEDTEKVVSKIDENGNVTTYKVDPSGKIGNTWP